MTDELKLDSTVAHSARLWNPAHIAEFFGDWELLEPGLVTCSQWRPDGNDTTPCSEYAAVARKPA